MGRRVDSHVLLVAAGIAMVAGLVWFWSQRETTYLQDAAKRSPVVGRYEERARADSGRVYAIQGEVQGVSSDEPTTVCAWCTKGTRVGASKCISPRPDGSFSIEGLGSGTYKVMCTAEGFEDAVGELPDGESDIRLGMATDATHATCRMQPGGARARGTVRSLSGDVLPGVSVSTLNRKTHDIVLRTTQTDREGAFEITVAKLPGLLRVRKVGYATRLIDVRSHAMTFDIRLEPAATLSGFVIEATSGEAVTSVEVTARRLDAPRDERDLAVRTDEEGFFEFRSLPQGLYIPSVSDGGWFGAASASAGLFPGATSPPTTVLVERGVVVAGRVINRDTGSACDKGTLELQVPIGQRRFFVVDVVGGDFVFESVPPSTYSAQVGCDGWVEHRAELEVLRNDILDLRYELESGFRISGTVVDGRGEPVGDLAILFSQDQDQPWRRGLFARSQPDGTFRSPAVAPGTYYVLPRPFRMRDTANEQRYSLADSDLDDVVVRIEATAEEGVGSLTGRVTDENGQAVSGLRLRLWSKDMAMVQDGQIGSDGRFAFSKVAPGGARLALSSPTGSLSLPGGESVDMLRKDVVVRPEETTEVQFVLGKQKGVLRGRVTSGDLPVAHADVRIGVPSEDTKPSHVLRGVGFGDHTSRSRTLTNDDGEFVFEGLADGNYMVVATRPDGLIGDSLAEVSGDSPTYVELVLSNSVTLSGRVETPDGAPPPASFSISVVNAEADISREEAVYSPQGEWRIANLDAGAWTVSVDTPAGAALAKVRAERGERIDNILLRLEGRKTVVGRVLDAETKAPVEGVRVTLERGWRRGQTFDGSGSVSVTNSRGEFRLEGMPPESVGVSVKNVPDSYVPLGWQGYRVFPDPSAPVVDAGTILLFPKRDIPADSRGMLGMRYDADTKTVGDGIKVEAVRPGSPADLAGLKQGDVIVSMRGYSVQGAQSYVFATLAPVEVGEQVDVGLADGRTVTLTAMPWAWKQDSRD